MIPVLLDIKILKIYTFGVFLVLAFFWSTFMIWRTVRLTTYKEEEIFDGLFFMFFGGMFAGRLFYVSTHFNQFGFDIGKFILINGYPGLSLIGCLFGGLLTLFIYLKVKKMKFLDAVDYYVPAILLGIAIGKLGSFFSGVEVGTKTTFFLALKYANMSGFRHLTPLYEAILFFIGSYLSYKILFEIRRDKYKKGFLLSCFIAYFSFVYVLFDPLKTNVVKVNGISITMVICASLLLTYSIYFIYYFRSVLFSKKTFKVNRLFKKHGTQRSVPQESSDSTPKGEGDDSQTDQGSQK